MRCNFSKKKREKQEKKIIFRAIYDINERVKDSSRDP